MRHWKWPTPIQAMSMPVEYIALAAWVLAGVDALVALAAHQVLG
jgi:hypothetical protein